MQTRNRADYTIAGHELVAGTPICAWWIVLRLAYHFGELRTRFTTDRDIRKARAMSATFTPALNDARMRFAVPSGIFSIPLILLLRMVVVWPYDDALVAAAAAVSLLEDRLDFGD